MTLTDLERQYIAAADTGDERLVDELAALIDTRQRELEDRLNSPAALREAALWYASQGVPVFPCLPGEKRPATAHGFKDATTDVEQVAAWWRVNPLHNIGTPTGLAFDVFDCDGPQGVIALGDYIDAGEFPPVLAVALTPRGRHYLVPPTGQGNTTNLLPKVDYRGAGGYVVAPPSRTPTGVYRWTVDRPLAPASLAVAA